VQAGVIPSAAEQLQSYLRQITGGELPLVALPDDAGDQPPIVFEVIRRVPGGSRAPGGPMPGISCRTIPVCLACC
jgi:hypothetical protein